MRVRALCKIAEEDDEQSPGWRSLFSISRELKGAKLVCRFRFCFLCFFFFFSFLFLVVGGGVSKRETKEMRHSFRGEERDDEEKREEKEEKGGRKENGPCVLTKHTKWQWCWDGAPQGGHERKRQSKSKSNATQSRCKKEEKEEKRGE